MASKDRIDFVNDDGLCEAKTLDRCRYKGFDLMFRVLA